MGNNEEYGRLFVAVDMPEAVTQYIERIQDALRRQDLFMGRFTKPEQVHITLKFIGEVPSCQVSGIGVVLQGIKVDKMKAQLGGLDVFAVGNKIKIIYIRVICPELTNLAKQVEDVLLAWCEREKRDFVSHATIARVKRVDDKQRLRKVVSQFEVQPMQFVFDSFVLKQSVLLSEGPIYKTVETYPLR